MNPTDGLSVPLKIRSQNFYELQDIEYSCIQIEAFDSDGSRAFGNAYLPADRFIQRLSRYGEAAVSCMIMDQVFRPLSSMKTADFMVTVSFRPWIFPDIEWLRTTGLFRFRVVYGEDGRAHVLRQSEFPLPPGMEPGDYK